MNTWAAVVAAYLAGLHEQGRAEVTCCLVEGWLSRFVSFMVEHETEPLAPVTAKRLLAFQQGLWWQTDARGRLYSAHSRYQGMQMVRAFLRWAHQTGRLRHDPTTGLVLRRPVTPPAAVLTPSEAERLLLAPDAATAVGCRDRLVLALFYYAVLERQECHDLNLADADLATQTLSIRGRNPRRLALDEPLVSVLALYLTTGRLSDPEPALLMGRYGRLTRTLMSNLVPRYAQGAGLGSVSLQRLRRSGVARRFEAGDTLEAVQQFLGHRWRNNTRAYQPPAFELQERSAAPSAPTLTPTPEVPSRRPFYRRSQGGGQC